MGKRVSGEALSQRGSIRKEEFYEFIARYLACLGLFHSTGNQLQHIVYLEEIRELMGFCRRSMIQSVIDYIEYERPEKCGMVRFSQSPYRNLYWSQRKSKNPQKVAMITFTFIPSDFRIWRMKNRLFLMSHPRCSGSKNYMSKELEGVGKK